MLPPLSKCRPVRNGCPRAYLLPALKIWHYPYTHSGPVESYSMNKCVIKLKKKLFFFLKRQYSVTWQHVSEIKKWIIFSEHVKYIFPYIVLTTSTKKQLTKTVEKKPIFIFVYKCNLFSPNLTLNSIQMTSYINFFINFSILKRKVFLF